MEINWIKVYNLLFRIIENETYLTDKEFYSYLKSIDQSIAEYEDFAEIWINVNGVLPKKGLYWNIIKEFSSEQKFDLFSNIVNHLDKLNATNLDELKVLFSHSIIVKQTKKTTSSTLLKKTEAALYQVIIFISAITKTLYDFMFRPNNFAKSIQIDQSGEVSIDSDEYEQPLVYLFFFTVLCALYGYAATSTEFASKLLLEDAIFKPFINILGGVWHYVKELNWSKLFIIMIPLVLFTVLYAVSMTISSKLLKYTSSFRLNLYLCSYYFGTYLFLHGLLFSYAMITSSFNEMLALDVLFNLILIWHLIIILLILKNLHSFFVVVKL